MTDLEQAIGLVNTATSESTTATITLDNNQTYHYHGRIPGYTWWPTYWTYEDKMAKAFRTVKILMDKKLIKLKTIEQFVELVDEISKVV